MTTMVSAVTSSGPQFTVNTETNGRQSSPHLAGLIGGGYVVTWTDDSGMLGDASGTSVKAQVFDANDNRVGSEFLVNTNTTNNQIPTGITGLSNGGFVVTWYDTSLTLGDASGASVKGQVFDALGNKIGSEFLVNTNTAGDQTVPQVTALAGGGFAVAWTDASGTLGDASGTSVKAQVFDNAGTKIGSEFLVNTNTTGDQDQEQISALTNGNFIVTWRDASGTLGDSSGTSIKGQIVDPLGNKIGTEFLVNTNTANDQSSAFVAGLSGGGFVVVWEWSHSPSLPTEQIQFFDNDGNKIGTEVQDISPDRRLIGPTGIAALSSGGFVVTQTQMSAGGPRGSASVFDANGNKMEAHIGTSAADYDPTVGALNNATFIFATYMIVLPRGRRLRPALQGRSGARGRQSDPGSILAGGRRLELPVRGKHIRRSGRRPDHLHGAVVERSGAPRLAEL